MAERVGEGRVASVIDARTFRMQDGREVRLAGVEDTRSGLPAKPEQRAALESLVAGRDIVLRGSPKPDRYGRIVAFAFVQGQDAADPGPHDRGRSSARHGGDRRSGLRLLSAQPRGTGAAGQKRHLGGTRCLKKHGNAGRYFGGGWAIRRGGRQGAIRPRSRGNALHQFRPALDAGLRGDYFKAEHCSLRGGREFRSSLSNDGEFASGDGWNSGADREFMPPGRGRLKWWATKHLLWSLGQVGRGRAHTATGDRTGQGADGSGIDDAAFGCACAWRLR